ncbi:MAG TPA: TonB-dependent receptor [Alphaproteobacteria bacterium]|nr:TonB-dependent receptor [Alphaproteobacteria bacterium]
MTARIAKTLFTCSCLAGTLSVAPAFAQQSAQPAASGTGLEEIVVTARRREERLQTVPVAVTAFTAVQIQNKNIESSSDLQHHVPSLMSSQQSRDEQVFYLRGQGPNGGSGGSPGVIAYFAEVPFTGSGPGIYFDLDNLQVLRGPQGTLFGQNTTGGAVLFEPKHPTNNFEGYVQMTLGNYNRQGVQAVVNIPIIDDKLMVRIAGDKEVRDGYTYDIGTHQDLDNRDYWSGRVGVTWRPTEDFENYLVYDSLYSHTNGTGLVMTAVNPHAIGVVAGNPFFEGSFARTFGLATAEAALAAAQALGPRKVDTDISGLDKTYSWGITDIARWDATDNLVVKNIFAYREVKNLLRSDFDGTPYLQGGYDTPDGWEINNAQYTDELQFQGKALDDKLSLIGGAFFEFLHPAGYTVARIPTTTSLAPGLNVPVAVYGNAYGQNALGPEGETTRTEALFLQGVYDFSGVSPDLEGLKLTAGARYTWDYRSNSNFSTIVLDLSSIGAGKLTLPCGAASGLACTYANHTFQAPTWTVGLDYQVDPDTLLYAKGSRGFKAGGFNGAGGVLFPNKYESEYVTDVEVGVKADWNLWGIKGRTNLDGFHDDYRNAQRAIGVQFELVPNNPSTTTSTTVIANGDAEIQGIELESTILPFNGLELTASWSYVDAKYTKFIIPTVGDRTDLPYPFVPKNKFGFTADYTLPFVPEDMGNVHFIANYVHTGRIQYSTDQVEPFGDEPGYGLLDLRINWNDVAGQPIDAAFFMTNVTDNLYSIGKFGIYSTEGFVSQLYGEPQMWGFSVKYRFGGAEEPETAPAAYVPPPVAAPAPAPKSYLVFFDFNKSDLTPQATQIVDTAAKNASAGKVTQLTVTGHTDTVGSDAYNMRLSRRRAESVAAQLEKDGVAASEISIVAKGKRGLLVPTADGVREPQNRRVQIVFDGGASS